MTRRGLALALALALAAPAAAAPLDDLLQKLRSEQLRETQETQERLQRFRSAAAERDAMRKDARKQIRAEEKLGQKLEREFRAGEKEIAATRKKLAELSAHYQEVFATARLWAVDLKEHLHGSLVSAQFPGRAAELEPLTGDDHLFSVADIDRLLFHALQEADQQGRVARFTAPLTDDDGNVADTEVVRVGPFTATAGDRFLEFPADIQRLQILPTQPRSSLRSIAEELQEDDEPAPAAVLDPSRGTILSLLKDVPDLLERVHQGGPIGYLIILMGAFGLLFALMRNGQLFLQLRHTLRQHHDLDHPQDDNALGRVALVYQKNRDMDPDALEDRIHEAISEELPRLNWGLNLLRVLAAIAPLLGLLGTVVGMIQTFQDITLFGTGEPRMMAGGISQALVTTALGLSVAIPILLLLTMARSFSSRCQLILEEQSLGLLTRAHHDRS